MSFYISISSGFFGFVSYILIGYYSNLIIRKGSFSTLKTFIETIVKIDINKISVNTSLSLFNDLLKDLQSIESGISSLYNHSIPSLIMFISLSVFICVLDYNAIFFTVAVSVLLHIIIPFSLYIKSFCDISKRSVHIADFSKVIIKSARGIQFFNTQNKILKNFSLDLKKIKKEDSKSFEKHAWESIFLACILFCIVCGVYFFKDDYCEDIFKATEKYFVLVISSIFSYAYFLSSYIKFSKIRKINTSNYIPNDCVLQNEENLPENRRVPEKELFIAFHGVCFHDPSLIRYQTLFDELTFSVLPKEMLAITGENAYLGKYVFDMLLKFYKPQSGSIYVAGANIKSVDVKDLRSKFSIFDQYFGIVQGKVYDNITLGIENTNKELVMSIADKVDIADYLEDEVIDEYGEICVSQDILIRIQMARVFLSKADVVLITEPESFDCYENFSLFYNFIRFISSKKTTLLITKNPNLIIYSNKILYINNNKESLFGSHADLCSDENYRNFLSEK